MTTADPTSPAAPTSNRSERLLSHLDSNWVCALGYVALLFLSLLPLLSVHHPPLQDYPNHLARMFILLHPHDEILSSFWEITWRPVPNLAMDLIVPPLAQFMPLAYAGKTFVALTIFLATSGTAAVQWALYRRISPFFLASFLFVHHLALQKGFLNYSFACGLALWAFAGWVLLARRSALLRLAYGLVASAALYFAHLHGFGIFALAIGAFELSTSWAHRKEPRWWVRPVVAAASALPAALFFLLISPKESKAVAFSHGDPFKKLAFASYLIPTHSPLFAAVLSFLIAVVIGWLIWSKTLRIHNHMLLLSWTLISAYVVLPSGGIGGANIDWRTLVVLPFFFLAAAMPTFTLSTSRVTSMVVGLVLLGGVRFVDVQNRWQTADRTYTEFHKVTDGLRQGSSLLTLIHHTSYFEATIERALLHLSSYAVIERKAFVPRLFSMISQQPLSYRTTSQTPSSGSTSFIRGPLRIQCSTVQRYDYVLLVDPQAHELPCELQLVKRIRDLSLYKVARPEQTRVRH